MTPTKAKMILDKIAHCRTDSCPPDECVECDYGVTEDDCNEALETAIEALNSFQTQMSGTSDLVSRQYLLDEYDRQHVGPPGGARRIIEEAPSVSLAQQWISCSERMPEEYEWVGTKKYGTTISDEVYVTFENPKGERFCKHISFQNGKLSRFDQLTIDAFYKGSKPIAWMSLPEPWKGEQNDDPE